MLCSRWNGSRTDQSSSGPTTASSWQLRNPDTCTPTRKRLKIAASSSFTWSTGNCNQKFQCSTTIVWIPPIVDRPILVLKCEQGFVGYKTGSGSKLECNKANYEAVQVERGPKGLVFFKGTIRSWRIRWRIDLIKRFFFFICCRSTRSVLADQRGWRLCRQWHAGRILSGTARTFQVVHQDDQRWIFDCREERLVQSQRFGFREGSALGILRKENNSFRNFF